MTVDAAALLAIDARVAALRQSRRPATRSAALRAIIQEHAGNWRQLRHDTREHLGTILATVELLRRNRACAGDVEDLATIARAANTMAAMLTPPA